MLATTVSFAQKITYGQPDKDDNKDMDFEIIGKVGSNVAVYKTYRDLHYISIYNDAMELVSKTKIDDMPDKVINADFINYGNRFYFIYQYQKRSIVYCNVREFDANANPKTGTQELDTTKINFAANNRIYNIIVSEDKKKIGIAKINSQNEKRYVLTTLVFDDSLTQLNKFRTTIDMPDRNDALSEFAIDNDGDISFIRGSESNNSINKLFLKIKPLNADTIATYNMIDVNNVFLDDIHLKVDNLNKRILVSSFYSKQRRGNVEGLYTAVWSKSDNSNIVNTTTVFSQELRADARGDNSIKQAFNDYYLQRAIMKGDGGFILISEAAYQTTRGGTDFNRWNWGYGSRFLSPYGYYNWGPYGNYYPWGRNQYYSSVGTTRYYADNILVTSFDKEGKLEWSNIVRKSQFDDYTDNFIGYNMILTSGELRFIFNQQERRTNVLSEQIIDAAGQITRKPTLKNLDQGYEFMPRFSKQIASRTVIIPCRYRNYITFAKMDI